MDGSVTDTLRSFSPLTLQTIAHALDNGEHSNANPRNTDLQAGGSGNHPTSVTVMVKRGESYRYERVVMINCDLFFRANLCRDGEASVYARNVCIINGQTPVAEGGVVPTFHKVVRIVGNTAEISEIVHGLLAESLRAKSPFYPVRPASSCSMEVQSPRPDDRHTPLASFV